MSERPYDPDYDFKSEESLAQDQYPSSKMEAARNSENPSLAAQVCTPEVWQKYRDKVRSGPANTPAEPMDPARIGVDLSEGGYSEVFDRIDVSNWRRIGLPEYELVEDMINCANYLAEREDAL